MSTVQQTVHDSIHMMSFKSIVESVENTKDEKTISGLWFID